jgi:hypothetical protein
MRHRALQFSKSGLLSYAVRWSSTIGRCLRCARKLTLNSSHTAASWRDAVEPDALAALGADRATVRTDDMVALLELATRSAARRGVKEKTPQVPT